MVPLPQPPGSRIRPQLFYSCIPDGNPKDLQMKEGNIFSDPLFIDPSNGNYHLQSNSPCIDAGIYVSFQDKDGISRPQDGNNDGIAICDMGAYEFFTETEIDQNQPAVIIPPIAEIDQNQPIQLDQNQPIVIPPIEEDQNQPAQINQDTDKSSSSSGGCFIKTIVTIKNSMFMWDKKRGINIKKE